jgi:hypothetical protein
MTTPGQYPRPQYPGQPPDGTVTDPSRPQKRKRIFMWVFLALQGIFLAVLIAACTAGANSGGNTDVSTCFNHGWYPLYTSQADCVSTLKSLSDAGTAIGTGIGAAIIIGLWVAVDVILGITRLIVVFNRKDRSLA